MDTTVMLGAGLGGVFLAILLVTLALAPAVRERHQLDRSLAALQVASFGTASPGREAAVTVRLPRLRRALADLGRRLPPNTSDGKLVRLLDHAGNPAKWDAERVAVTKVTLGLGLAVVGALLGTHAHTGGAIVGGLVGAAAGLYLPNMILVNIGQRRQALIQKALPDSMDMLTISVEAGLSCDAGIAQVARNTEGPLAAEFARLLQEMQLGKSRADAFRSLHARTEVGELRSFVSSVIQAEEFGLPIADVLRAQSAELRLRRRQRAEEKAQKVAVKMTVPMIMCVFPALFSVTIGPGLLNAFHLMHH